MRPGAAAAQRIDWVPSRWRRLTWDGGEEGKRVHAALDADFRCGVNREQLWALAGSGRDPHLGHAAVLVWGCGARVRSQPKRLAQSLREGYSGALTNVADAAAHGLEATWDALYRRPPPGLGGVPFGSKWLHFAGWHRRPKGHPPPLILDQFVRASLTQCAGVSTPEPERPTRKAKLAWIHWCQLAHSAAMAPLDAPVQPPSSADVELALFEHARGGTGHEACPRARGDATAPCPWRVDDQHRLVD